MYAALTYIKIFSVGNIGRHHCLRLVRLYSIVYRLDIPLSQVEEFITANNQRDSNYMVMVDTKHLIQFIRDIVDIET